MVKVGIEDGQLGRGGQQPQLQVVPPIIPTVEYRRSPGAVVVDIFKGDTRGRRRAQRRLKEAQASQEVTKKRAQKEALKAAGDERWRLVDITVEHTNGSAQEPRGWNSYIDEHGVTHNIPETKDSSKTPFNPLILLVDPRMLGTHEATTKEGLNTIDFSKGWDGPAIAVAAVAHANGQGDIYQQILRAVTDANDVTLGVLPNVRYGKLGVLDGHHRREKASEGQRDGYKTAIDRKIKEALRQGLTHVPVQLIPYGSDPSVVLDTWHSDGRVWTHEQVYECFQDVDKIADAKRTKFGVKGTDGVTRRILDALPNVKVPLENLLPAA